MAKKSDCTVSVIIPTYRTSEEKLLRCLVSAAVQTLDGIEIIVVDDNGERSEQKKVEKLIKEFKKTKTVGDTSVPAECQFAPETVLVHARDITYICQGANRGLVTARRTGVEAAHGEYVTMLDSDDEFKTADALRIAYASAGRYDIVQFCAEPHRDGAYILEDNRDAYRLIEHPAQGVFTAAGDEFAQEYLASGNYCLFLWAKLIRHETLLRAFEQMPLIDCFMAEDTLFSYFLTREATSYIGISNVLYIYNIGGGISTSAESIASLDRWKKLCTPADVFTAIMYDMQERPFPAGNKVPEHMRQVMAHFAVRNTKLLERVVPELREEAEQILKEAWGEDIIARVKEEKK